jgi:hypothetical protein
MPCSTCGREQRCHGSEAAVASGLPRHRETYAMESGCHDGVWMDDDTHGEGWERDVIYPPCPYNPAACDCVKKPDSMSFGDWNQISYGTGLGRDDCAKCGGNGWRDGQWQHPVSIDDLEEAT